MTEEAQVLFRILPPQVRKPRVSRNLDSLRFNFEFGMLRIPPPPNSHCFFRPLVAKFQQIAAGFDVLNEISWNLSKSRDFFIKIGANNLTFD